MNCDIIFTTKEIEELHLIKFKKYYIIRKVNEKQFFEKENFNAIFNATTVKKYKKT